jgi:hypothetical protein
MAGGARYGVGEVWRGRVWHVPVRQAWFGGERLGRHGMGGRVRYGVVG